MQLQPSSSQLPEFACTFLCSVAKTVAPAVCPDYTDRSNALGRPLKPQLLTRMSAGLDCFWSCPRPLPASSLGLYKAFINKFLELL